MTERFFKVYQRWILQHPWLAIFIMLLIVAGVGSYARQFHLDASADSLVLENDQDLKYFRQISQRYGQSEFLVISYSPDGDLYAKETLDDLEQLRDSLLAIDRVDSVMSILDVPLISSPPMTLGELSEGIRTLRSPAVDIELARQEFQNSPLYSNMLVSQDERTTALQVVFARDQQFHQLLEKRNHWRQLEREGELSAAQAAQQAQAEQAYDDYNLQLRERETADIARIRAIMDQHRDQAELFLGGVPMIVVDMIDFIRHDLATFGLGVLTFLVAMLIFIFRRPRWVLLPMFCCGATVLFMFGFLGLVDWKVTVVSSNFTSLLLIITLSLCVHLVVRYNELFEEIPGADQTVMVREMIRTKAVPSIFTALTTIVAFASLLISDIRPVMDFGWMMATGICFALLISFVLFPAGLMLLPKPRPYVPRYDLTGSITRHCAAWVENRRLATLSVFVLLALASVLGISRLTVENRFIDYFKSSTEIYQGMALIDKKLGGTTPLDVILEADPEFLAAQAEEKQQAAEDPFADDFFGDGQDEEGLSGSSYWYNNYRIDTLKQVHDYLEGIPQTGKVLSMATTMRLMQQLNDGEPLDNLSLAVIHKKLPPAIKEALFNPYMAEDGNQVRFSVRVVDSDPSLRRDALLTKIRGDLTGELGLKPEQVNLTGMFVLYNNVLQSLFSSQIKTIGVVFLVIMGMFLIQFRSLRLALIGIIPNLLSAAVVLGLMGLLGIPLDIMTITIAAITIGIAVDDTIHYIHRYNQELAAENDPLTAMRQTHDSVGRAMFYTSVTIICGFSILALSNFLPTIYFGLFTGLAMLVAMFANLTLLALLLLIWKPRTTVQRGQS